MHRSCCIDRLSSLCSSKNSPDDELRLTQDASLLSFHFSMRFAGAKSSDANGDVECALLMLLVLISVAGLAG